MLVCSIILASISAVPVCTCKSSNEYYRSTAYTDTDEAGSDPGATNDPQQLTSLLKHWYKNKQYLPVSDEQLHVQNMAAKVSHLRAPAAALVVRACIMHPGFTFVDSPLHCTLLSQLLIW